MLIAKSKTILSKLNFIKQKSSEGKCLLTRSFNYKYKRIFDRQAFRKKSMQKGQEVKVQLTFNEYPSIELSTRDKFIKKIKQDGHDKADILWVASEKIHGSNFSIHYFGKNKIAKYGRRTDFLSNEIPVPCDKPQDYFNQTFYDAKRIVGKTHNYIDHVFQKVKESHPETEIIQIYGEYFGGAWPEKHPNDAKGPKAVQKGVYYTRDHEFMVFDIKVTTPTSSFWIDVIDIPKFLDEKFMHVPVYAKGTFEEMLTIETVIDSTIPELLGLKKLEKNIIEGMVLRPNSNLVNSFGQRVILKKKNEQFLEKASAPKVTTTTKQKKQSPKDPEVVLLMQKLTPYLNFNRIESVISKFPDVKDRNKLKQEICKDIYSDADKDEFKWPHNEELTKKLRVQLDKLVIKELNSYFIKH